MPRDRFEGLHFAVALDEGGVPDESRIPDPQWRAIGRFDDLGRADDFFRRSLGGVPRHRLVTHDHVAPLSVDPAPLFSGR